MEKHSDGSHAQEDLPAGPSRVTPTKEKEKDKRQKWSREDYKEVMYAFYMSPEKPAEATKILLKHGEAVTIMLR